MSQELKWIKTLPNGWIAIPLKAIASYSVSNVDKVPKEDEIPVELCNYTDVYKNDFITTNIEFMQSSATEEEIQKFQLTVGDVLITKDSESWDDIGIPALVLETKENLLCGYHLAIIRSNQVDVIPEYLFRCIEAKVIRIQLELASTGVTRFGLPKDEIGRLKLPIPAISVQQKIVSFLKSELLYIDRLITQKEQLINILSEKRQSLITQAVTRGLDPNIKLKESGIDWLGEVPEHWEIKKIKYLADLKSGDFISTEDIRDDAEYPVYGGNGLRGFTSNYNHSGNFVLIGRQGALCGNINYAFSEFWATEHAIVCKPKEKYDVLWFGELLRIMNLNQYSIAAAQPGLSVDVIKNLFIPVPKLTEQKEISDHIKTFNRKTDEILIATQKSLNLLNERRIALISAAVTGQIEIPKV